jgi:hypothetical protein
MVCQSIIHKSYAEQIMASCQDDDDHCPMMALDELNKTVSRQMVLGSFSDLIQLYDKNNYSCHHEGHHLGMWLYDYTRNLRGHSIMLHYSVEVQFTMESFKAILGENNLFTM